MEATEQGKQVFRSIKQQLERSQKLKQELLPYLQEHYPALLQKKSRFERIKECANAISFRRYIDTGEVRLINGSFCKYDRICLACAIKRSMKMIKRYADNIAKEELKSKQRYFITLTIKHQKRNSLEGLLGKLFGYRDAIARRFRNSKRPSQKSKSFFSQFDGMAVATEITHTRAGGWHSHINILACSDTGIGIDTDRYDRNQNKRDKQGRPVPALTNEILKAEWNTLTGRTSYIHNIRKIVVDRNQFSRSGIGEVFKYAIKFSDLSVEQLAEVMAN